MQDTVLGYKHLSLLTPDIQRTSLTSELALLLCNRDGLATARPKKIIVLCYSGGWCGITLGPKICLAGNIATHTPHQGVCHGGCPKQGWGHPALAFEHTGLLNSASKRTHIQHLLAQNQNSGLGRNLNPQSVQQNCM